VPVPVPVTVTVTVTVPVSNVQHNIEFTIHHDSGAHQSFIVKADAKDTTDAIRKGLTIARKMDGWTEDFEKLETDIVAVRPKQGRLI